jgi:RNA polymerase sigma-70 factor (ECF subfamily)
VERVFESHGAQVWRAVLATTAGQSAIADEATAEAFARLYAHRAGVRDPVAWVFRTAFGIAAVELGRQRLLALDVPPESASPGDATLTSELKEALLALSPEQRSAVFLHYVADLSIREVANLSGAPVATVKVRLHRARRTLRTSLAKTGDRRG